MAKFKFVERPSQSFLMDCELYIEGANVTDWIMGDIGISLAGTGGNNSLNVTLANPSDVWLITTDNIAGNWRMGDGTASEYAKYQIWANKKQRNREDPLTKQFVYNLSAWQPIFHKHDCARLFVRNPHTLQDQWMPRFTGFVESHPTSEDYTIGQSTISLTFYDIKGMLKKMRVSLNPMPSAADTGYFKEHLNNDALFKDDSDMFSDLWSVSARNHPLAGKDLVTSVKFLLLGPGAVQSEPKNDRANKHKIFGGVLTARTSSGQQQPYQDRPKTFKETDLENKIQNLNANALTTRLGGVNTNFSDLSEVWRQPNNVDRWKVTKAKDLELRHVDKIERTYRRLATRLQQTQQRADEEYTRKKQRQRTEDTQRKTSTSKSEKLAWRKGQVGRFTLGRTLRYPDAFYTLDDWHNLCLLGNLEGDYLTYDQVKQLGTGTVLDNVIGSPFNGELHFLLPQEGTPAASVIQINDNYIAPDLSEGVSFTTRYDLLDEILGTLDFNWMVTPAGDIVVEFPMFDFNPDIWTQYKNTFTVDYHSTNASFEDEASDVPTAMIITGQEVHSSVNDASNQGLFNVSKPNRTVVYSPILASRYGALVEEITAPVGVTNNNPKNLELWGSLQLQKRIGQSSTFSQPLPWRPWLLPNRPLHYVIRERMGLIQTISESLAVGNTCSSQPNVNYVRTLTADGKYRYVSGGENMPINYNTFFTGAGDTTKSGIRVQHSTFKGSSQGQKNAVGSRKVSLGRKKQMRNPDGWAPHFKYKQLAYSGGNDQSPIPPQLIDNAKKLSWVLETIWEQLGQPTLFVSSGYRAPAYNRRVGGTKNSFHMKAMAADIVVKGVSPRHVASVINQLQRKKIVTPGGLGRYPNFTHVDIRGELARWNGSNVRAHPKR